MKLRDLNPLADPPTPATLIREELPELERLLYLEDKRADHHAAAADALRLRISKLRVLLAVADDPKPEPMSLDAAHRIVEDWRESAPTLAAFWRKGVGPCPGPAGGCNVPEGECIGACTTEKKGTTRPS